MSVVCGRATVMIESSIIFPLVTTSLNSSCQFSVPNSRKRLVRFLLYDDPTLHSLSFLQFGFLIPGSESEHLNGSHVGRGLAPPPSLHSIPPSPLPPPLAPPTNPLLIRNLFCLRISASQIVSKHQISLPKMMFK